MGTISPMYGASTIVGHRERGAIIGEGLEWE